MYKKQSHPRETRSQKGTCIGTDLLVSRAKQTVSFRSKKDDFRGCWNVRFVRKCSDCHKSPAGSTEYRRVRGSQWLSSLHVTNRESVTGNKGAGVRVKGGKVWLKPSSFFNQKRKEKRWRRVGEIVRQFESEGKLNINSANIIYDRWLCTDWYLFASIAEFILCWHRDWQWSFSTRALYYWHFGRNRRSSHYHIRGSECKDR